MSDARAVRRPGISSAAEPAAPAPVGSEPALVDSRPAAPAAVAFDGVSRSFSGVPVLKGVTLQVHAGRMLALVGENGAGKSTLMNILGGSVPPETGALRVAGQPYAPRSPQDARAAGIAFVHQELNLFPNLTIDENLHLQAFPCRAGLPWIDRGAMARHASALLAQVGLATPPDTPLERLSAGERQLVEIAKALGAEARVLILDEPTTSLSARERDRLFALLHDLRAQGLAIIYISHDLADVSRLCDEVAVLRDGVVVAQGGTGDFTTDRLVTLMIGREVPQLYPPRPPAAHGTAAQPSTKAADTEAASPAAVVPTPSAKVAAPGSTAGELRADADAGHHAPHDARDEPQATPDSPPAVDARLDVRGLSEPGILRDVSFTLARGEILGLFGVMGAGRSELARILFGLDPAASGEVRLDGEPLHGGPRQRQQRGLAFVTEDRRHDGLCLDASISDNVMLTTLAACCTTPMRLVQEGRVRAVVRRIREAVRLSPSARDDQPVRTLSGGNQQKVVLARWLLAEPRVLILDEPTRGVDVGARAEIYALIRDLATRGAGVLLISSEIEELIGLSDRILVMRQGEISAEFPHTGAAFDRARLLTAALPDSRLGRQDVSPHDHARPDLRGAGA